MKKYGNRSISFLIDGKIFVVRRLVLLYYIVIIMTYFIVLWIHLTYLANFPGICIAGCGKYLGLRQTDGGLGTWNTSEPKAN